MDERCLDNPGDVRWFSGHGPAPVVGLCPHAGCQHFGQAVIAWGPDLTRYELVRCDDAAGCAGRCRAWTDGSISATTPWLHVGEEVPA